MSAYICKYMYVYVWLFMCVNMQVCGYICSDFIYAHRIDLNLNLKISHNISTAFSQRKSIVNRSYIQYMAVPCQSMSLPLLPTSILCKVEIDKE